MNHLHHYLKIHYLKSVDENEFDTHNIGDCQRTVPTDLSADQVLMQAPHNSL